MDDLSDDWREFLSSMISHRVKYLLIGGHAVAVHASPRLTEDLDVWVEPSVPNARRLRRVLVDFGFGDSAPSVEQLSTEGKVTLGGSGVRARVRRGLAAPRARTSGS